MGTSFFDLWFDSDYRQRRDINALHMVETALESDIATMAARIRELKTQVNDLSLTVAVLLKILQEQNLVDPKILHYRVEAEADAIAEAARAPQPVGGAAPKHDPGPTYPVKCDRCGAMVAANRTTITANGTLCDRCAA